MKVHNNQRQPQDFKKDHFSMSSTSYVLPSIPEKPQLAQFGGVNVADYQEAKTGKQIRPRLSIES